MNKINKISVLLFCLLFTSISAFAASEAEYKKVGKTYKLNSDGSQEYRYAMELTLYTHTAMNGTYGESFILYNPQYQELQIHSSYTVQKDGSIVETPPNAFVEVLPRFAADAPAYNNLKEMVVVHTGLELGATIYLDYSIISRPGFYPALDIDELLSATSPIKEYSLTIIVPHNTTLTYHLYDSSAKAIETKTSSNGQKTVNWTLHNVPASSREAFLPENNDGTPRLIATTYTSQPEALGYMKQCFNNSMNYESKAFAQYITENATNDKEKIEITQRHVVENIDLCPIPLDYTGFTIRNADDVLCSAYGTATEKTQLLCSMLNAAGIESEIVAFYPANMDANIAGIRSIKKFMVKATSNGKDLYLSAFNMEPINVKARGILDNIFTLDGKQIQVNTQPLIIKENKEINIDASMAKGGFIIYTLPVLSKGIDTWNISSLPSRRAGLFEIPSLLQEEITYTINKVEGLTLKTPVGQTMVSKPYGKVTQTITSKDSTIEVIRTIELNKQQFTPAEYSDLRVLLNEWTDPNNRLLLFSEK